MVKPFGTLTKFQVAVNIRNVTPGLLPALFDPAINAALSCVLTALTGMKNSSFGCVKSAAKYSEENGFSKQLAI